MRPRPEGVADASLSLYRQFQGQGFEVIGISLDEDHNDLDAFTRQMAMGWPQFFDGQGWNNQLAKQFGVRSIPMTCLLDRQGIIIGK